MFLAPPPILGSRKPHVFHTGISSQYKIDYFTDFSTVNIVHNTVHILVDPSTIVRTSLISFMSTLHMRIGARRWPRQPLGPAREHRLWAHRARARAPAERRASARRAHHPRDTLPPEPRRPHRVGARRAPRARSARLGARAAARASRPRCRPTSSPRKRSGVSAFLYNMRICTLEIHNALLHSFFV